MPRGRVVHWLVRHIPEPLMAAPERVLINFACLLIGISGLIAVRPGSLLALWPRWVAYEWAAAMLVGGACALFGYWTGRISVARLGYLLICFASLTYGVAVLVVFGKQGAATGVIFLGIAVAKALRLLLGSAIRAAIIETGRLRDRP